MFRPVPGAAGWMSAGGVSAELPGQQCGVWGTQGGPLSESSVVTHSPTASTQAAIQCHPRKSWAALSSAVAPSHMWLLKCKLKLIITENSVSQSHWQHFQCSGASGWLLQRTHFHHHKKLFTRVPKTRRSKPEADVTSDQSLAQLSAQGELMVERHAPILLTPTSVPKNCHLLLPL